MRIRAVPLIAPRLAWSASASSAAVCSGGSQMRRQPHIRPAIGVMPYEAEELAHLLDERGSRLGVMRQSVRSFGMFSQY